MTEPKFMTPAHRRAYLTHLNRCKAMDSYHRALIYILMQMMTRLRRFADVGSRISTCFLSIGVHAEHFTQQNKRKAAFSMICPLI